MEKWGEVVALTAPLIPKSASAPPLVSLLFLLPQPAQASRWVRGLDGRVLEADPVCAWAMWLLCRYLGYQVSCPAVARVLAEQRIATILMACVGIMKILYMKNFCRPIRLAIHPFTTLQSRGHLQFSCLSVLLSFKWPRIIFSLVFHEMDLCSRGTQGGINAGSPFLLGNSKKHGKGFQRWFVTDVPSNRHGFLGVSGGVS